MTHERVALLKRLALAVLVAALLFAVFVLAPTWRGFPTGAQMATAGLEFGFFAVVHAVLIPGLYFVSVGAGRIGFPRWMVFPVLFVALCAGYSYVSLSHVDQSGIGPALLVERGRLTASGWIYFEQRVAGIAAIALIANIVLFGRPSTWIRADS
jgi:hypothetical protein